MSGNKDESKPWRGKHEELEVIRYYEHDEKAVEETIRFLLERRKTLERRPGPLNREGRA